jgi:hypothetical protein
MPSDVRYAEVSALFKRHGWWLRSIHGSHHKHTNGTQIFSVPVHRGKVKYVYYREIKKMFGEA